MAFYVTFMVDVPDIPLPQYPRLKVTPIIYSLLFWKASHKPLLLDSECILWLDMFSEVPGCKSVCVCFYYVFLHAAPKRSLQTGSSEAGVRS